MKNNSLSLFDLKEKDLYPIDHSYTPSPILKETIQEIALQIQEEDFPCIGAKQVFNQGKIYIGEYGDMKDPNTASDVYKDIKRYSAEAAIKDLKNSEKLKYATFLSSFPNQALKNQLDASKKLYILLKNIIELDVKNSEVAQGYSRDPNDRNFAMSVGEVPYFTAFFHPLNGNNPRKTNNAIAVNWNTHYVFDLLKRRGDHSRWEETIKNRIKSKHGEVHPDLVLNGAASELAQYNLVDDVYRDKLQEIMQDIFEIKEDSHVLRDQHEYRSDAIVREEDVRSQWGNKNS